jgi:hypothetical protein
MKANQMPLSTQARKGFPPLLLPSVARNRCRQSQMRRQRTAAQNSAAIHRHIRYDQESERAGATLQGAAFFFEGVGTDIRYIPGFRIHHTGRHTKKWRISPSLTDQHTQKTKPKDHTTPCTDVCRVCDQQLQILNRFLFTFLSSKQA